MIMGFSKLFSDIIHSTVWREEMHVKVVWITMLAMADRHGQVLASIPGLADSAKVTLDQCLEALDIFKSPDEYSRTKDYEGRRVIEIEGGWLLLNYEKFRERKDDEEQRIKTRERVRKHRELAKVVTENVTVTPCNDIQKQSQIAESDSEAPTEEIPPTAVGVGIGPNSSKTIERVMKELGVKKLDFSEHRDWTRQMALAFENDFTPDDFIECLSLLRKQTWRTSPVKGKHVVGSLPDLPKLRLEVKQGNGKSEREKSAQRGANAVSLIAELRRQGEIEEQEILSRNSGTGTPHTLLIESAKPH